MNKRHSSEDEDVGIIIDPLFFFLHHNMPKNEGILRVVNKTSMLLELGLL